MRRLPRIESYEQPYFFAIDSQHISSAIAGLCASLGNHSLLSLSHFLHAFKVWERLRVYATHFQQPFTYLPP